MLSSTLSSRHPAGVTSGAVYAHFGSKQGLFARALESGLEEVLETIPRLQHQHGAQWLAVFVDYYLSPEHRRDLDCGCAMATLTPEVLRFDKTVRALYQDSMQAIISLMAQGEPLQGDQSAAWAVLSQLIGGLTMARAVQSEQMAVVIAESVKAHILSRYA